jgi:hypothetical protein
VVRRLAACYGPKSMLSRTRADLSNGLLVAVGIVAITVVFYVMGIPVFGIAPTGAPSWVP